MIRCRFIALYFVATILIVQGKHPKRQRSARRVLSSNPVRPGSKQVQSNWIGNYKKVHGMELKMEVWPAKGPNSTGVIVVFDTENRLNPLSGVSDSFDNLVSESHRRGLAVAVANIRASWSLESYVQFPAPYNDAADAIRFLKRRRIINSDEVYCYGHGVEGFVCSVLAARNDCPSTKLAGAVLWSVPTNFAVLPHDVLTSGKVNDKESMENSLWWMPFLFGIEFWKSFEHYGNLNTSYWIDKRQLISDASAVQYLSSTSAPMFLILDQYNDIPLRQTSRLLEGLGSNVATHCVMSPEHELQARGKTFAKAFDFLQRPHSSRQRCECNCENAFAMPNVCSSDHCPQQKSDPLNQVPVSIELPPPRRTCSRQKAAGWEVEQNRFEILSDRGYIMRCEFLTGVIVVFLFLITVLCASNSHISPPALLLQCILFIADSFVYVVKAPFFACCAVRNPRPQASYPFLRPHAIHRVSWHRDFD